MVGTSSEAENLGVSFGHGNKVIGSNSGGGQRGLALGNYLTVKGEEAVAVGTNASATADWAIAMGKNSKAEKEKIASAEDVYVISERLIKQNMQAYEVLAE
ncbi:MAG: hypothetical protein KH121_07635 [Eubacterium sp.]|nr:hypothetical protein [Eubacterium sp.]